MVEETVQLQELAEMVVLLSLFFEISIIDTFFGPIVNK